MSAAAWSLITYLAGLVIGFVAGWDTRGKR